jgi:hypothetical protein
MTIFFFRGFLCIDMVCEVLYLDPASMIFKKFDFFFLFIDMVCEVLYLDLVCLCSHLMLFKKKNTYNKFSIFLSWYKNTLKKQ